MRISNWSNLGLSQTPEYNAWIKMIRRCHDSNNKDYARYHGKGIYVCQFLRESAANFIRHMGRRPDGTTLDRIDNHLSYTCGRCDECAQRGAANNVRWANRTVQARNQDRIRLVEVDGQSKCIGEWASDTGIHYQTLMSRYKTGVRGRALIAQPSSFRRRRTQ